MMSHKNYHFKTPSPTEGYLFKSKWCNSRLLPLVIYGTIQTAIQLTDHSMFQLANFANYFLVSSIQIYSSVTAIVVIYKVYCCEPTFLGGFAIRFICSLYTNEKDS